MNQAHWHLVLTHFPIVGTIFSSLLLFAGIILKNSGLKRSGLILFVLTGLLSIPTFLTGEGAEDFLEKAGVKAEKLIEKHEELGEIAIWTLSITGLIALVTLILDQKRKSAAKFLGLVTLVIGISDCILLKNLGTSGGEIRHVEIRKDTTGTATNSQQDVSQQEK